MFAEQSINIRKGEMNMHDFLAYKRFKGLKPFENKLWLSSPTMHGEEQKWVDETISFNGNNVVSTSRFLIDRGVTTDLMHRRTNYAA
jgi:hypothetical protein